MSHRFMMFVDGSNLYGVGNHLEVTFPDYEVLFGYLFHSCYKQWAKSFSENAVPSAQYLRVYWYVVGSCDQWDLDNPQVIASLRERFERSPEVMTLWARRAEESESRGRSTVAEHAWEQFLEHTRIWYEETLYALDGMNRFHYSVESTTDLIEVKRSGHWKLDMLRHRRDEKGVDTAFAVDMATMIKGYDVALLISGDADGIPAIQFVKNAGKQVGAVEILKGYPPEERAKNLSAKLKATADFVTPIYEEDLVSQGIAHKREPGIRSRQP